MNDPFAVDTNVLLYSIDLDSPEKMQTSYDFQIFDAIVVASALEAGCSKLYTEDMHPGLVVENHLQIVNPFL